MFRRSREFERAQADCDTLLAGEPENPKNYNLRAIIALKTKRPLAAIPDLRRAVELDSKYEGYWFNLAHAYLQTDSLEAAEKCLSSALELEPDAKEELLLRGGTRYRLGNADGAEQDYRRVLELEPGNHRAKDLLGRSPTPCSLGDRGVWWTLRRAPRAASRSLGCLAKTPR